MYLAFSLLLNGFRHFNAFNILVDQAMEAQQLFDSAWDRLLERAGGTAGLVLPREIVWLNGAPGNSPLSKCFIWFDACILASRHRQVVRTRGPPSGPKPGGERAL